MGALILGPSCGFGSISLRLISVYLFRHHTLGRGPRRFPRLDHSRFSFGFCLSKLWLCANPSDALRGEVSWNVPRFIARYNLMCCIPKALRRIGSMFCLVYFNNVIVPPFTAADKTLAVVLVHIGCFGRPNDIVSIRLEYFETAPAQRHDQPNRPQYKNRPVRSGLARAFAHYNHIPLPKKFKVVFGRSLSC